MSKRHRARQLPVPRVCPFSLGLPAGPEGRGQEGTHRVWMARREVKVPLARLWILLSYRERSDRFCRSWKASGRTQLILLAFKSLWADQGQVVVGGRGAESAASACLGHLPGTKHDCVEEKCPGAGAGRLALQMSPAYRKLRTSINCPLCARDCPALLLLSLSRNCYECSQGSWEAGSTMVKPPPKGILEAPLLSRVCWVARHLRWTIWVLLLWDPGMEPLPELSCFTEPELGCPPVGDNPVPRPADLFGNTGCLSGASKLQRPAISSEPDPLPSLDSQSPEVPRGTPSSAIIQAPHLIESQTPKRLERLV